MRVRAWLGSVGMAVAVAAAGSALVACGDSEGAKFASVKAGEMPQGETWVGVYYNPVYGYLHMVEQEGNVVGRWKRTNGSHWGQLSGTVDGNVMHFTWKEHQYGAIGVSGESHGKGVFVYKMGEAAPELDGQFSLYDSDQIGDWHCVKQARMTPDINSINGQSPADAPAAQEQWQ